MNGWATGEAERGVSPSLRDSHPEVPRAEILALRNILVHGSFGLNPHQVWNMTQKALPHLEKRIQHIRSQIDGDPASGK